jgi:hypothetical protein
MKNFIVLLLLMVISYVASSQKMIKFTLPKIDTTIANSEYNSIQILDSREDTTFIGEGRIGLMDRKAKIVTEVPLSTQISNSIKSMIAKTAISNNLLLQIRNFRIAVSTSSYSGICQLRANLYLGHSTSYKQLSFIDTSLLIKSYGNVTDTLIESSGKLLLKFIIKNLSNKSAYGTDHTYADILHIDSVEKLQLKLYTAATLADGQYLNYLSFKNQIPDGQITVDGHYVADGTVNTRKPHGKLEKLKLRKTYAIVHDGVPYMATQYGLYRLIKSNSDFFFTGDLVAAPGIGNYIMTTAFGVLGVLLAFSNAQQTYYVKLDHVNGGFIRLKEIPGAAPSEQ